MGNEIDTISEITLEQFSRNPWNSPAKGLLKIDSRRLKLVGEKAWRLSGKDPNMELVALLIDDNILFAKAQGTLEANSMQQVFNLFSLMIDESNQGKLYLVLDLSEMSQFSLLTRTIINQNEERLRKYWNHIAIIPSPLGKTLISLYRLFKPQKLRILTKVESIGEAFEHILDLKSGSNPEDPEFVEAAPIETPDYGQLSRTQLEQLLIQKEEENQRITAQYQDRINTLFESIGKITWDKNFQPVDLQTNEDDPFFDVFNLVTILQQDVYDIVDELKILNESLEERIAKGSQEILLKESNLRSILENNDASIWLIDSEYRVIDFNETFATAFKRAYGKTLKPGMVKLNYLPDKDLRKIWKARYDKSLGGEKGVYIDTYNLEGKDHVYEINTYPIEDHSKVTGVSIFSRDITKQKKTEKQILSRSRQLKKLNQELDRFVYSTSHDLRAPLVSLKGLIEVALRDAELKHMPEYLNRMMTSVEKLDHFIQEITNYSRNSRLVISREKIDLESMCRAIFQELKYIDIKQKVRWKVKSSGETFYSDPNRISVIMNNLISNSLRYADPNKDEVEIVISLKNGPNRTQIRVEDNGIGIDKAHIDHIFDMFYRGTEKSIGTGLGLYIAKETVEKLGGVIRVKSKAGKGTRFKIELPARKAKKKSKTARSG